MTQRFNVSCNVISEQNRKKEDRLLHDMVVAASSPSKEILRFDWFISGRIFPVLTAQGRRFEKSLLMV